MVSEPVIITVTGTPAPQGSKRHVGHGRMIESSAAVKPWREAVKWAAARERGLYTVPLAGAVEVDIRLYFPRPKSHFGTGRNALYVKDSAPKHPAVKPDVDKCARACLDALTDAGVYRDDAQVVVLCVSKNYAIPAAGLAPGAVIRIQEVTQ